MGRNYSTEPLSLKANVVWNAIGSLVFFGCTWLLSVFVVRLSGDYEAAGVLALAMAVFNTFRPLVEYRIYTYQISDTDHENTLGESFTFCLITSFTALICATIYAIATCPGSSILPVILFFIYKIANLMLSVFHAVLNLNSRMDYNGISNGLQGIGILAVFIAIFYPTQSLEAAFIAMTLVTIAIGILYTYPHTAIFEKLKLGISAKKTKHLFLTCLPIVIASIACSACPAIPRQFLALTQGESLLGAYASVAAPAAVIQMGASYIYTPLISSFARSFHAKDKHALVSLLVKAVFAMAGICLAAGVVLTLLGEWILVLFFGESITPFTYMLVPAIIMTAVSAFLWFFNDILIGLRKFQANVIGNVIALVATLALTIPLVDAFSANGISFTVMIAYAIGAIAMAIPTVAAIRKL